MHIHIMTAGGNTTGLRIGLNVISGIDKAFILSNEKYSEEAENLRKFTEELGATSSIVYVKPYDYKGVIDSIFKIHSEEETLHRNNKYSVNATGGTKVMAMAACTASMYIGATTYYVRETDPDNPEPNEDCVMILDTNKPLKLKSSQKTTIKILHFIEESTSSGKTVTNTDIADRFDMSKQAVAYQIKKLRDDKLIETKNGVESQNGTIDYRKQGIVLSPQGFTVIRHMGYNDLDF